MTEQETRSIERQQRWEMDAVSKGIERYRENDQKALSEGRLAETKPGIRMLNAIMPHFSEALKARRHEAQEGFGAGARNIPHWWMPILALSPEKLAYITIRTVMSASEAEVEVRVVASRISRACEMERHLDLFKEAERQREKAMAMDGHEKPENVYKLMCHYAREINPRTFKRWKSKVDNFNVEPWGNDVCMAFGTLLIHTLVEHGGGWFQVRTVTMPSRSRAHTTKKYLEMTPEAVAFLGDHRSLDEVNRPWLVPMLTKPVRWAAG